jgi:methylenetetrahydrofolate reductase (NADPH)
MTRICDLLDAGPTLSFELFPPKTDEAERMLEKAVVELAELRPSFVSVTYGALGSTRERTRDVVTRINHEQPFPAMPHLTCVGHSRRDAAELLDHYADNGVENILALGGDPPADGSDPGGEYEHASQLVEQVRAHPAAFAVAVAAHPEVHPRSPDRATDRRHLARKLEAADFAVTQFFYDADDYFRMVDELDALGCTKPVIPGVMPMTNPTGVQRMAKMSGASFPDELGARIEEAPEADRHRIVVDAAAELSRRLLDGGVPGLHLYCLNRSEVVIDVAEGLGLSPNLPDRLP